MASNASLISERANNVPPQFIFTFKRISCDSRGRQILRSAVDLYRTEVRQSGRWVSSATKVRVCRISENSSVGALNITDLATYKWTAEFTCGSSTAYSEECAIWR